MKIFIPLVSLFLSLYTFKTQAQNRFEFGVKGGYVMSSVIQKNKDYRLFGHSGYIIGGFAKIPLSSSKKVYFQPELLFSLRGDVLKEKDALINGFTYHIPDNPEETVVVVVPASQLPSYIADRKITKNHMVISAPLNLNIHINNDYGLILGAEPSLIVHGKTRVEISGDANYSDNTYTEIGQRDFDLGLNLGFYKTFEKLHIELRYTQGVINVTPLDEQLSLNSTLQLTFGYQLFKKASYY